MIDSVNLMDYCFRIKKRLGDDGKLTPDFNNVVSLIRQLSWTHFIVLILIKDELKRDFYAQMP